MVEQFGDFEYYDKYDMSYYTLKRDPMIFKYHRSDLQKLKNSPYEKIADEHLDYKWPKPKSIVNKVDNIKYFKVE